MATDPTCDPTSNQPSSTASDQAINLANISSVARVFNITELLEGILSHLAPSDIKTLLLSQRVNRAFQATITGSIRLQKALFFRPSSASSIVFNPLLVEPKIGWEGPLISLGGLWWFRIEIDDDSPSYTVLQNFLHEGDDGSIETVGEHFRREIYGSWQKMHLSSAVHETHLAIDLEPNSLGYWYLRVDATHMLTAGELVDRMMGTVGRRLVDLHSSCLAETF